MFLPQRYNEVLTDQTIIGLNASTVVMTYLGKDAKNQNRLMLDFNAVEVNEEEEYETGWEI